MGANWKQQEELNYNLRLTINCAQKLEGRGAALQVRHSAKVDGSQPNHLNQNSAQQLQKGATTCVKRKGRKKELLHGWGRGEKIIVEGGKSCIIKNECWDGKKGWSTE